MIGPFPNNRLTARHFSAGPNYFACPLDKPPGVWVSYRTFPIYPKGATEDNDTD